MLPSLVLGLGVAAPVDYTTFGFDAFKAAYGRTYPNAAEEARRREVFEASKQIVLRQNDLFARNLSTWFASINAFSDMTEVEFSAAKKGLSRSVRPSPPPLVEDAHDPTTLSLIHI